MRNLPFPPAANNPMTTKGVLGSDMAHESAHKHVSGEATYIDDQLLPADGLHAYVGLSTVSRGIIKELDLSAVLAAEGVVEVLSRC